MGKRARDHMYPCIHSERGCQNTVGVRNRSGQCRDCQRGHSEWQKFRVAGVRDTALRTMESAPTPPDQAEVSGSVAILSDTHFPYHCGETIAACAEDASVLGIDTLVIAGDIIHAPKAGRHPVLRTVPNVVEELLVASENLSALSAVFKQIYMIPGNHDQWVEKQLARGRRSSEGRSMLSYMAALLKSNEQPFDVAWAFFSHFLEDEGVKMYTRPRITINGSWRIGHPKSAARATAAAVKKLAMKHRKHYVGGHNHLFGIGFDDSGENIAFNIGPACVHEKFPYADQEESDYPTGVRGYGFIYCTPEDPVGRLIPVAVHENWFRPRDLIELANGKK